MSKGMVGEPLAGRFHCRLPFTYMPAPAPETEADVPRDKVLELVVIFPDEKASVPLTVTPPPRLMPFARFRVRLLSVTAGSVADAPEPPMMMFDVLPPVKPPLVVEIAPLRVSVFAPMESAPLVSVSVPPTLILPSSVAPLLLLMVRLL